MKKLLSLLFLVPIGIVLIVLSVANRQMVTLSLDPFNTANPAISTTVPFFVYLFGAVVLGMLIGGMATWWTQGKHRKCAREERAEARRLKEECETLKKELDQQAPTTESGLPILSGNTSASRAA